MQKSINQIDTTIIFKVDNITKNRLVKRALLQGKTLSEYMRELVSEKKSKNIKLNPLLKMAGIMTQEQAKNHNDAIYNSRQNKN